MKEKSILMAVFLITAMVAMAIAPAAKAWEYADTTIANPQTDDLMEPFGPRADKLQINMYSNEQAEFTALEADQIDMTDWPIDTAHYAAWTQNPLQQKIGVSSKGAGYDMFIIDMQMNPNPTLYPGGPANPAYTAPFGNPMADVWLRRAIACVVDRRSPPLPYTGALYTPLSSAYGSWQHTGIDPLGNLWQYTYAKQFSGDPDVNQGNLFLNLNGYSPIVGGFRTKGGVPFQIQFYYRTDDAIMATFATAVMMPLLTQAPPNGLGLDVLLFGVTSAGGRAQVEGAKKGHLYTAFRSLNKLPTHLYDLFHIDNYWHPGLPPNYMYYPGDANKITAPNNGWNYNGGGYGGNFDPLALPPYSFPALSFSDTWVAWGAGSQVWENPQNYWSSQMMYGTGYPTPQFAALRSQEAIAYWVCGVPVWHASPTAFHRTYTGAETPYAGQPWMGVVNQKGFGVWSKMSFYDMHPANALFGDGENMIIRWGFRQPVMSLNPIYASDYWDWLVLNQCYDNMITADPYTLSDMQNLADNWELSTWDSPDYGTCTKVTFHMRHDLFWSDGMPLTSSDVKFTWGGPLVTGSISNLLAKKGYPPAYWSTNIADMISVATPDPWTVISYLDVYSNFGLYSMSGFNIVLPEHVWNPIILTGDPTQPWDQPSICSSGWIMDHTWDPMGHGGVVTLSKNTKSYWLNPYNEQADARPRPIRIWTNQSSNAREVYGNTHYIYPKSGDTTINLEVSVNLHNYYIYETGAYKSDVFPMNYLDGTKDVTLLAWTGSGSPGDPANYAFYRTIATTEPWSAYRCETEKEDYNINGLTPWWYMIEVNITINSLHYFDGVSWVDASGSNPFNGMTYTYREYALVTNRYDIGGTNMKPFSAVKYQPISDVKVDVKDLYACGKAYGTLPGYANWNHACDINNDFKIDIKDYYKIAQNYGWTATPP